MMTCEDARHASVLAAYGELESRREGALRAHLLECPACAGEARNVRAAREMVARAEGHALPEWAPTAGPAAAASGKQSATPRMPVRVTRWSGASWGMVAAAVLVVVAAVVLATRHPATPQVARQEPKTPAATSSPLAAAHAKPLDDDAFDEKIRSLSTDVSSLESHVGEF